MKITQRPLPPSVAAGVRARQVESSETATTTVSVDTFASATAHMAGRDARPTLHGAVSVSRRGVQLLLQTAKSTVAAGRAWWRVTAPAHGASRATAPDVAVHAIAAKHLANGDSERAWRALADSGDGFARLVSSTLSSSVDGVYAQMIDAHWQRITGQGVTGALYRDAAKDLAQSYLDFSRAHGVLPTTEDIERMDRANLQARGLSPLLAVGAMQSKLAHDLGSDYAWGRAMGLPPERVAHGSTVFADADFDATTEIAKSAYAAVTKYGFDKAMTIDGAVATLRGLKQGGGLAVSPLVVMRAKDLAAKGDVAGAWRELARHGDDYAESAAKIIGQKDAPRDLLACIVDAHWLRIVGADAKAAHFDAVAVRHIANYLALLDASGGKLPNTRAIERSYRDAVVAEGLPPLVAIDALLSRADTALPETWLAKLGVREFSWGAMCGMPPERISYRSDVFADLDIDPSRELGATTLATIRLHAFAFLRPRNLPYTWNAIRELF